MNKIIVSKKDGYTILADINPKTKKLYNFSATGVGVNPNVTYIYVSEVESLIEHLTKKQKENKKPTFSNKNKISSKNGTL